MTAPFNSSLYPGPPGIFSFQGDCMSIRLRTINGVRVALCAAECVAAPGDTYLDDADHHALFAKFMATQKLVETQSQWKESRFPTVNEMQY